MRLLILLSAVLIPACASSSPAFLVMYSAYKLNKQGDNIQPWCTPFPIWSCLYILEISPLSVVTFHSFIHSCPVFPAPFIEETLFAPLYVLAFFVKNKVPIGAWVYFWAFYLVSLVYISVFVLLGCLMTVALYYSLKSGRLIPPAPFFFLKTALASQGLLCFHMNCEMFCSSSVKNAIGNLIGVALNL